MDEPRHARAPRWCGPGPGDPEVDAGGGGKAPLARRTRGRPTGRSIMLADLRPRPGRRSAVPVCT
ncbi:hypothetical protein [Ornithinimicrobium kibberense]|uniref:hypothetical protein n=1 Tax=Ornithinimicrobium kibberense TaxID=282060 RepID=UPI003606C916